MIDKEIIYVLCGLRDLKLLEQSIQIIKSNDPDFYITVYYNEETGYDNVKHLSVNLKSYKRKAYDRREENRNSSLMRLESLIDSESKSIAYLDNDVFIVDWTKFLNGFEIAKIWGLALPLNPRNFLKTELDIGADVSDRDKNTLAKTPQYMPAVNMGVMFYCHFAKSRPGHFMNDLILKQRLYPSRGQMALYYTMWIQTFTPLLLPYQWLVCQKHVGIDNPICLHVGHKPVMEWWKKEFKNVRS